MSDIDALEVYAQDRWVGTLFDEQPLRFRYADTWLRDDRSTPISPGIPLSQQEHRGDSVYAYFENLLPEGDLRRFLSLSHHATTVFGLLRSVGGDTASGLTLLPQGENPAPAHYRQTSWEAIAEHYAGGVTRPLMAQNLEGSRLSLAGAQDKLLLMLNHDGTPAFPEGSAPSTHILKPNIRGLPSIWSSALNETLCMQLAAALGLGVAEATYQPETRACLVRRYDRHWDGDGHLQRLHQLDLCQLDGKPSTIKYEADGGPSLVRCRELVQQTGVSLADLKRFLNWVFFNLYVGNNDSHAKNLSVLFDAETGWRLAPFYDLMCTTLYAGLSNRFAFRIGGEDRPGQIHVDQLNDMAKQMGFKPKYVIDIGLSLGDRIPAALDAVIHELQPLVDVGSEQILLERLQHQILGNCRKRLKRWQV